MEPIPLASCRTVGQILVCGVSGTHFKSGEKELTFYEIDEGVYFTRPGFPAETVYRHFIISSVAQSAMDAIIAEKMHAEEARRLQEAARAVETAKVKEEAAPRAPVSSSSSVERDLLADGGELSEGELASARRAAARAEKIAPPTRGKRK